MGQKEKAIGRALFLLTFNLFASAQHPFGLLADKPKRLDFRPLEAHKFPRIAGCGPTRRRAG
jgi:hypothetical protein